MRIVDLPQMGDQSTISSLLNHSQNQDISCPSLSLGLTSSSNLLSWTIFATAFIFTHFGLLIYFNAKSVFVFLCWTTRTFYQFLSPLLIKTAERGRDVLYQKLPCLHFLIGRNEINLDHPRNRLTGCELRLYLIEGRRAYFGFTTPLTHLVELFLSIVVFLSVARSRERAGWMWGCRVRVILYSPSKLKSTHQPRS